MQKYLFLLLFGAISLFYACTKDNALTDFSDEVTSDLSVTERGGGDSLRNACHLLRHADSIAVSALPKVVTDYVTANFANQTIAKAAKTRTGQFVVRLSGGKVLLFNAAGKFVSDCQRPDRPKHDNECLKGDSIAVTALPKAVQDSIAKRFPNATIVKAVKRADGSFAVAFKEGPVVLFGADGKFQGLCGRRGKGGPHGGPKGPHGPRPDSAAVAECLKGTAATAADLPKVVQDALAKAFPKASIEKVVKRANGDFAIKFERGPVAVFSPAGKFLGLCPERPEPPKGPHGGPKKPKKP